MDDIGAFIWALPVLMAIGLGYGAVRGCQEWTDPAPCKDYTYSMSAFRSDVAACERGMKMELDKRILGKDLVHCTCLSVEENNGR